MGEMSTWEKVKFWLAGIVKGFNDYLMAHPVLKNWIDGLEKVVMGTAISYILACLSPEHTQAFTISGFVFSVWGAIKAYSQNLHDIVLANTQDITQAIQPTGTAAVNKSALTPVNPQKP